MDRVEREVRLKVRRGRRKEVKLCYINPLFNYPHTLWFHSYTFIYSIYIHNNPMPLFTSTNRKVRGIQVRGTLFSNLAFTSPQGLHTPLIPVGSLSSHFPSSGSPPLPPSPPFHSLLFHSFFPLSSLPQVPPLSLPSFHTHSSPSPGPPPHFPCPHLPAAAAARIKRLSESFSVLLTALCSPFLHIRRLSSPPNEKSTVWNVTGTGCGLWCVNNG